MDNTEEIWKTYPEFDFIEASNLGRVRTKDHYVMRKDGRKMFVKGRVLKQELSNSGYLMVKFGIGGKVIHRYVHRICATCFLPNPDNLPEVNHIDCNKVNNTLSNLEWCTSQYNIAHREKYGISAKEATKALRHPVYAVNLETSEVLYFSSYKEASRQLQIDDTDIGRIVKGQQKYSKGYWFTDDKNKITEEKIQEINNSISNDVFAVNLETLAILRFKSQHEAARLLGFFQQNINGALKGRQKTVHGYWFCYADENAIENVREKFGNELAEKVKKLISER